MGDNDPIDACEIGTMVSSSLIYLFFIYYFYLFIYLFSFSRQARPCMRQAWSCAICKSVCLARHIHIILALTRVKNAPALFASLLMVQSFSVFLSRSDLYLFFLHFFPLLLGIWSILGEKVEKVIKIIMLKSLRWVGSRRSFPFLSFSESYKKKFLFVSGSL